jgi:glycosyltransferase involved in cell wall biosynthesis
VQNVRRAACRVVCAAVPNGSCVAAVFAVDGAHRFLPTLHSLREVTDCPIVVGSPDPAVLDDLSAVADKTVEAATAAELVNGLRAGGDDLLVVSDAVVLAPGMLERAHEWMRADLRIATVSAFSNAGGHLSFPERNRPVAQLPSGHDERSVTRRLRDIAPDPRPASVPMPAGAAVLVSAAALGACGALDDAPSRRFSTAIADFAFRARRRGFLDVLDPGSFYSRPIDLAPPTIDLGEWLTPMPEPDREWLRQRHPAAVALLDHETTVTEGALGCAFACARSKVLGLRVLLDAPFLGPLETGAQVTTLAIADALADRDDVAEVVVAIPGPVPHYARRVFGRDKIRAELMTEEHLARLGHVDVAHRPLQPDLDFDPTRLRTVADRLVVSLLDLIAYQIGSYHETGDAWLRRRDALVRSLRAVDAVTTISHDVKAMAELENLPLETDRVFVIPYGTEHLTGNEPARPPAALRGHPAIAGEFLLCMGTNYTHKNRDLAVGALNELVGRGREYSLVLAGPSVPYGTSRVEETITLESGAPVAVLPDVTAEERNWLLRHAAVVVYPTSAEGFGLVPFEAARFGTPTVHVAFGPLLELWTPPVAVDRWDAAAFADAVEALADDPALAKAQVETALASARNYAWSRTADQLAQMYRTILAMPSRQEP